MRATYNQAEYVCEVDMYFAYVMSENAIISRNRSLEKENKSEKHIEKTRYESTPANEI